MYSLLTDAELTELLKSGDELVFTEIYNRYWKRLLAISYNHTKDKFASKDIVQEVFISLWNRREILTVQSLNNYLAKSIKFSIFKYIERKKRHLEIETDHYLRDKTEFEDDVIEAKFLKIYINGIVEELPEKCQQVFKFSRTSGMSIPEISKRMSIAEKTVESHLTKALKNIRTNLIKSGLLFALLARFYIK